MLGFVLLFWICGALMSSNLFAMGYLEFCFLCYWFLIFVGFWLLMALAPMYGCTMCWFGPSLFLVSDCYAHWWSYWISGWMAVLWMLLAWTHWLASACCSFLDALVDFVMVSAGIYLAHPWWFLLACFVWPSLLLMLLVLVAWKWSLLCFYTLAVWSRDTLIFAVSFGYGCAWMDLWRLGLCAWWPLFMECAGSYVGHGLL